MKLEKYLEENHPDVLGQYRAFIRKDTLPKIGVTVKTIRGGFGDWKGGRHLRVVGYGYKGEKSGGATWGDNFIVLRGDSRKDEYLSRMDEWWNDFVIVNE
jgi:hypothetical protein